MWITGDISDFSSRLHELPTGSEELITGFQTESIAYANVPNYQKVKWSKEIEHKWYEFDNFSIKIHPLDDDSVSFFNRASLSDIIHKQAVNNLVVDLKKAKLWDSFDIIYPMVGGTANSHQHNLISSNYSISFGQATVHNSYGAAGDGQPWSFDGWAYFFYTMNDFQANADIPGVGNLSIYVTVDVADPNFASLINLQTDTQNYWELNVNASDEIGWSWGTGVSGDVSSTNNEGFFQLLHNGSQIQFRRNNLLLESQTRVPNASGSPYISSLYGKNIGGVCTNKTLGFAAIAPRMNEYNSEYYEIVQAYQQLLSRSN